MRRIEARARVVLAAALAALLAPAWAEAPRWITGPPYFTAASGNPVVWYTTTPFYFTDPGDLSANVNHAAADALVAAAAGVWNVPTSAMEVAYGGALAEHVSAANSYLSGSGPVFPGDVESANYAAIQIAVMYDSDGSVTDMLLGGGASSPAECRQNAVTESVDSIAPAGLIQHAILVLNGRCTGPAPEHQFEMQYQLAEPDRCESYGGDPPPPRPSVCQTIAGRRVCANRPAGLSVWTPRWSSCRLRFQSGWSRPWKSARLRSR